MARLIPRGITRFSSPALPQGLSHAVSAKVPMKALMLSECIAIHTARWANALSRAGVQVWLATQHPVRQALDDAIEVIQFPYRGIPGYFLLSRPMRRILRDVQPDILNAHFASGYGTTGWLTNWHPYLLSVWGSDVYRFPDQSPLHRWLVRKNLVAADVVASTSHCMADRVRSLVPDIGEIPITPFGIDIATFASVPPAANGDALVIGTVKSMETIYGIDTLIDAFAVLRDKLFADGHPLARRISLRLVGGGSRLNAMKQRAEERGLADAVTFTGRVPHSQVPEELAKLDVYVALSRQESFGVAVLEAGAAGRPVVVSDAEGLAEVVTHGVTGLVVPRENPNVAADALFELVADPGKRATMGEAGRQHVRATYAWEGCVRNMLSVYEETVRRFRDDNARQRP